MWLPNALRRTKSTSDAFVDDLKCTDLTRSDSNWPIIPIDENGEFN